MAGIGGARPHGAGSWKFSATAPKPLCRTEESPPQAAQLRKERPAQELKSESRQHWPGRSVSGAPGAQGVSLPAPYLLLATHPLLAGSARGQPGKGRGGEVRTRTSERPARPAEPQAGGEQDKAASPEPPHPAAAAPRPALAPGGCRATCTGPLSARGPDR